MTTSNGMPTLAAPRLTHQGRQDPESRPNAVPRGLATLHRPSLRKVPGSMAGQRLSTARRIVLASVLFASVAHPGFAAPPAAPVIDFDRQVRPILSNNCFKCHGPDEEVREAGLRLDRRPEALEPADSGKPAIIPGKPDESTLVKRISSRDRKFVMPPPKTNKTLSETEKSVLREWVAQGARYQTHWAFNAPKRPIAPRVKDEAWPRNLIDRFILSRLEAEGLRPSPEADRATLIRRLTLDLTGLPPTPVEVDAFLNDQNADAYDRVVNRLLGSPHYGERMALDWLDASRFADTHGFHIDSARDMTRWREWVIDAFNRDVPFDQFTVEQLAGDLLPGATLSQKVASGFNRNHMITYEGGAIPEEYLTAYIVDRVNTTGTVWLGLTVGCTQCHDHKFDPMTQKEFYQLYAFFNNVPEQGLDGRNGNASPAIAAPSREQQKELERLAAAIAQLEQTLNGSLPVADRAQVEWEKRSRDETPVVWTLLDPSAMRSKGTVTLSKLPDKSIVAGGTNPSTETYVVTANALPGKITGLRLEIFPDDRLPANGPGRSHNGNFVLTDVRVEVSGKAAKLRSASADFAQTDFPVGLAIDDQPSTGWAIHPQTGKLHTATFELETPVESAEDASVTVALAFQSPYAQHQFGKFRLAITGSPQPLKTDKLPANISTILAADQAKRTDSQRAELRSYFRNEVSSETRALKQRVASLRKDEAEARKRIPTAMVMEEMPKPRDTFMLVRGQYDRRGDKVTAGVPAFLPPLPVGIPANRLGLAKWLVDPGHPLVSRVTVNRYWQSIFGTGIVKTAEDFGSQGEQPSHPELLDWLAVEFMSATPGQKPAWDVKALVRLLVTSATYRQASAVTPVVLAKDPDNRLLARAPRVRLQAEFIRDQALAISGLLDGRIGGTSVSPYQPPGLWEELMSRADGANFTAQTYVQSHGRDLYRRTMYTFWKRSSPPPSLITFDAPDRETCTVRRGRTNTPLQALVLLNDPTYVEASRKLAERIITEGGASPEDRIAFAFRLATARSPRADEVRILKRLLEGELAVYRKDRGAASKLLSVGEAPHDPKLDVAELAAWSTVAGVILNLDETVTKG